MSAKALGPLLLAALAGFVGAACVAPRERLELTDELARATDGAAIELRTEGQALDEAAAPADSLPLATALQLALHASPELQAALARVRMAEAEADQAHLLPNPILDVVLRFPNGGGETEIDAGISQSLFGVLARPRHAAVAEDRLAAAVAEAVTVALDLVAEVRTRHAAVQAQDELAALARERRALLERLLDVARTRLESGLGMRLDVTTLEAQALELELELEQREAARRRERLTLARLIGRPSEAADWELGAPSEVPAPSGAEGDWIARALAARPELQARRWRLSALCTEAGLAPWEVMDGTAVGLAIKRENDDAIGPSLVAPLPLFDWGTARADRAAAAVLEAREDLLAAQRQVVEEVRRAFSDLEHSRAGLARVQDRLLPLELDRRSQVEEVFARGQVDVTAVLLAEQGLQAAQTRRVEFAQECLEAWSRLERAAGGSAPAQTVDATRED